MLMSAQIGFFSLILSGSGNIFPPHGGEYQRQNKLAINYTTLLSGRSTREKNTWNIAMKVQIS